MNLKKEIKKIIKEKFGTQVKFNKEIGIVNNDLNSKLNTLSNKYNWVNDFLGKLGKTLKIIDKD